MYLVADGQGMRGLGDGRGSRGVRTAGSDPLATGSAA